MTWKSYKINSEKLLKHDLLNKYVHELMSLNVFVEYNIYNETVMFYFYSFILLGADFAANFRIPRLQMFLWQNQLYLEDDIYS